VRATGRRLWPCRLLVNLPARRRRWRPPIRCRPLCTIRTSAREPDPVNDHAAGTALTAVKCGDKTHSCRARVAADSVAHKKNQAGSCLGLIPRSGCAGADGGVGRGSRSLRRRRRRRRRCWHQHGDDHGQRNLGVVRHPVAGVDSGQPAREVSLACHREAGAADAGQQGQQGAEGGERARDLDHRCRPVPRPRADGRGQGFVGGGDPVGAEHGEDGYRHGRVDRDRAG
jgi:hypothetical protein